MNIGIMSMQRIFNYGSWMQAYALKNIIEEIGGEVQFIDYHIRRPKFQSMKEVGGYYARYFKHYCEEIITDSKVLSERIPNRWFMNEYNFKHRDLKYLLGGSLRRNYNSEVDCLVVGSDEVFNCLQVSPRVGFSPELLGHYCNARKKISYAASFGNTTMEKIIKSGRKEEIARYLSEFDAISVRDENSETIICDLVNKRPAVNLDPVLIWNFSDYLKQQSRPRQEKYMIVYTYPNRLNTEECEAIKKYAKKRNLKILGVNAKYSFLDEMIYDSPLSILQYFAYAECVIADTFHGTLFSIINHKPFATIVRTSSMGKYGNSEKLVDVLKRLGLTDRMLNDTEHIETIMEKTIDYEQIDSIIETERLKAYEYLRNSIYQ